MSKLAFDVQFGAFLHVLTNYLRQALPGHDVVPLGSLLPLITSIFVLLVGGEAEFAIGVPLGVYFTSGFLPTFPTRITLFTLLGILRLQSSKDLS